jgi:hypothetical protein
MDVASRRCTDLKIYFTGIRAISIFEWRLRCTEREMLYLRSGSDLLVLSWC